MNKKHFSNGISATTQITAGEFIPLCWQMPVVGPSADITEGGPLAEDTHRSTVRGAPSKGRGCIDPYEEDFRGVFSVELQVSESEGGGTVMRNYAGRALTFVALSLRGESEAKMYVLVEWYVSCVPVLGKRKRSRLRDLQSRHPNLRLPYIHKDPSMSARYDLIDTETVNSGLWVQEDFEAPGKFWVITCDTHDDRVA